MDRSSALLLYYPSAEATAVAAEMVGSELGGDVFPLHDEPAGRSSRCLAAVLDVVLGRPPPPARDEPDPADFDLVVVGTPVVSGLVPAAIRSYLRRHHGRFRRVAFFLTHGSRGPRGVFEHMAEICGTEPVGRLTLRDDEVAQEGALRKIQAFARDLVRETPTPRRADAA